MRWLPPLRDEIERRPLQNSGQKDARIVIADRQSALIESSTSWIVMGTEGRGVSSSLAIEGGLPDFDLVTLPRRDSSFRKASHLLTLPGTGCVGRWISAMTSSRSVTSIVSPSRAIRRYLPRLSFSIFVPTAFMAKW